MANALDAVLNLKASEEAKRKQENDSVMMATELFQRARQQAVQNQLQMKQYKAGLAERGIMEDSASPSGFKRDESLMSTLDQLITKGKAAEAARTLGDRGLFNTITGSPANPVTQPIESAQQTVGNMEYINEVDQFTQKPTARAEMAKNELDVQKAKQLQSLNPPTVAQESTALYASRLQQSNQIFDKLENFVNKQGTKEAFQAGLPDFANFLKTGEMQSYQQAQKNFLNAVLRRESGASISASELSEGRQQYFPQPGDKPEVITQKKANRDLVMKNFIKTAGKAYVPYEETTPQKNYVFNSEVEAEKANLPKGTIITINGRKARID